MILDSLSVDAADFANRTGWEVKPEGLCKGDLCVLVPGATGATLDVTVLSQRLGMPLLHDDVTDSWVLGPESGRALTTAVAPPLELPDLDGNPFGLERLHGQKVLLVAWASW